MFENNLQIEFSPLNKTWLLDLDGTIVKHNGYLIDGKDTFLPGAKDFLDKIPNDDMVIFVTSRLNKYKEDTEEFLKLNNIRYNYIIFEAPYGERVLVNDKKPSGLKMAYSINLNRDQEFSFKYKINENL